MFGSIILDVALGLVLVYLLLSLIASSLNEWIASSLKTRSTMLDSALHKLLGDSGLVEQLYAHPMISSLYDGDTYEEAQKRRTLPSYIPSRNFAIALLDLAARGPHVESALAAGAESMPLSTVAVRAQIGRLGNPAVQRAVLTALDMAHGDLAGAQANVEAWFNSMMDRVSGWYKRRTQIMLFAIGVGLAAVLDADTVRIAHDLYRDPAARQIAVAMASGIGGHDTVAATAAREAMARVDSLSQPLGLTIQFSGTLPTAAGMGGRSGIGSRADGLGEFLTALAVSAWGAVLV